MSLRVGAEGACEADHEGGFGRVGEGYAAFEGAETGFFGVEELGGRVEASFSAGEVGFSHAPHSCSEALPDATDGSEASKGSHRPDSYETDALETALAETVLCFVHDQPSAVEVPGGGVIIGGSGMQLM